MGICVPKGKRFADLKLVVSPAPDSVHVSLDEIVFMELVLVNRELMHSLAPEDLSMRLIFGWYEIAQAAGEPAHLGVEALKAEVKRQKGGLH